MESKNKTVLMTVIDTILEETVWVNKSGETCYYCGRSY